MRRARPNPDLTVVADWCAEALGSVPRRLVFDTGHLSRVLGLELADDRRVVVKVRPWSPRLRACSDVHDALFRSGYPCPQPLTGVVQLGRWAVSAEALVAEQQQLAPGPDSPQLFADALAELIRSASGAPCARELQPSPPWADWDDRRRVELWPDPDDVTVDLNGVPITWIDTAARRVREHLLTWSAPLTVGHLDWYSANLGWRDRQLVAVFDWDSVGVQPEAAIAGLAAAVWPATSELGQAATVRESEQFLDAYTQARPLSDLDMAAAWAVGVWARCFDAKKAQAAGDDPDAVITLSEARTRLQLANLPDDL